MAQLSDDCFAFGGALLPLGEAQRRIAEMLACVAAEESAAPETGRILARDVVAGMDLPPETNSAVDGYAVRHGDLRAGEDTRLPVIGRIAAGEPHAPVLPTGAAARVFTGAVLPAGADTVMMQEDCEARDGHVLIRPGIRPGANRRPAGEDVARGETALRAGRRLTPADLALLAALGVIEVQVRTPLRVAVFSTGNELMDPPAPLPRGAVYDANRPMLLALLRGLGVRAHDGGILPDAIDATAQALARVAASADLVITSGGVSTGEEDHVRAALARIGTLAFWRVAIKPGRPVAVGTIEGTPLIGLPGNPVAALVTFAALARPMLDRLAGATFAPPLRFAVPSGFAYRKKLGRREYVRVRLDEGGIARRFHKDGAGIITSLTQSDALMELPEAMTELAPGDLAPCIPLALLYV